MVFTVVTLLAVALSGLVFVNIDSVDAQDAASEAVASSGVEKQVVNEEPVMPSTNILPAVIRMVSALAVVVVLVYMGLYVLKRMMGRRYGASGDGALEILQTTYVGQHKAVSLVRVGERSVLLGVTDNQISALTELDADETAAVCETKTEVVGTDNFINLLGKAASKIKEMSPGKKQAVLET